MSRFVPLVLGLLLPATPLAAATYHVDGSNASSGNGLTWGTAFTDLQPALATAGPGDEIRVAAGVYKPGSNRADTFQLKSGVVLLGGYPAGGGERNADPFTNATVLSGDLGTAGDAADNSYHVVTGTGVSNTSILDGFTIRDGHADGDPALRRQLGGGLLCDGSGSPQLRNLLVTRNQANGVGGAMYLNAASPTFENAIFLENRTTIPGTGITGEGGAAYLNLSNATFTGGGFLGNSATDHGGALSLHDSDPVFTDVIFVGNTAAGSTVGGALYLRPDSTPTVRNCSFTANTAGTGGAIWNGGTGALIQNSIVWANKAATSPQIHGTAFIGGSTRNLVAGFTYNGGSVIATTDPRFVFQPFTPDGDWTTWADNHYGDLRLLPGSPAIDTGNNAANSLTTDADGNTRPTDGDLDGTADLDLGPYEAAAPPAVPPSGEIHRWTFDGDATDSVGELDLTLVRGARIENGALILNGTDALAITPNATPLTLGERTFIAWVAPSSLDQAGGGVLTLTRDLPAPQTFDGIVYGERTARQWMNGSNNSARSVLNNGGPAETTTTTPVMIALVHGPGNTITLYREGAQYSTAATQGSLITYKAGASRIRLGERHDTTSANRFFAGLIDEARVYQRALSAAEIAAIHAAGPVPDAPAPDPLADGPNLTRNAIVRQSSIFPTPLPDRSDPGLAIDANLAASNRSATAADDAAAWIEIELPRDAVVRRVEMLNLNLDPVASFRSRLRDLTIELRDAAGTPLASSPLLNPENSGYSYPDGPLVLDHAFAASPPARIVRITRSPDPDLSGSGGRGDPAAEANLLALRELRVFGDFTVPDPPLEPFAATFDSRRADPDPVSQLWFDTETVIGSDFNPFDGLIDNGSNTGLVFDGNETVWQVRDQITTAAENNPWHRNLLDEEGLRALFDLGWTFATTVRAISDASDGGYAGFSGWGFTAARNPGWNIGANTAARIGFAVGRNAGDNSFHVTPDGQPRVTLAPDSADDYHVITAVCPPRATEYEWFIDGVSQGSVDFAMVDVGGLTENNLSFGTGRSTALGGTTNWKQASLTANGSASPPSTDGLLFHLPFEPGPGGNEALTEKSRAPGAKPAILEMDGPATAPVPGARGQALGFPGGAAGAFLSSPDALTALGNLETGTISLWFKGTSDGVLLGLTEASSGRGNYLHVDTFVPGEPVLVYADFHDGGYSGLNALIGNTRVNVLDDRWHHAVVTIGTEASRIYVDGVLAQESTSADRPRFTSRLAGTDSFSIGAQVAPAPLAEPRFGGAIDEVTLWSRDLSAHEVEGLFRLGYLGATFIVDADGDGLNSLEETALGTSDTSIDSDGDGIPDAEEIDLGTDPTKADTDDDGIPDGEEMAGPTNALLADSDGDGIPDGAETLPARLVSRSFSRAADGSITFVFQAYGTATNLRVESAGNLTDFTPLPGVVIVANAGGLHTATATPPPGQRFFRAVSDEGAATDPLDPTSFQDTTSPDSDLDGFSDAEEILLGTDPALADSDDDDFSDYVEILLGTDPRDPASHPGITDSDSDGLTDAQEIARGTNPNLADSDNDTFSDHAEVNAGSDPKSAASTPASAVLSTESFVLQQNGDILFIFRVQGDAPNLRIQSSPDLAAFPDLPAAVITPLGGGRYQATATPPAGHRFFRAAADDGAGGTTSSIVVDLDLPAGPGGTATGTLEAAEGDTFLQPVVFSSPFTGYLGYTVTGVLPDGRLLPAVTGGLTLDAATTANLPLALFDDLAVGAGARYTVTLAGNAGLAIGLGSTFTLTVLDNDSRWSGTLGTGGEQLNFVLESLTNGTTTLQRIHSEESSSLLPRGSFPVTASFGATAFSAATANIPLLRELTAITAAPGRIASIQFTADDTLPDQNVSATAITGNATFTLAPAAGNPATLSATFNLQRQPAPAPSSDLNLLPSP